MKWLILTAILFILLIANAMADDPHYKSRQVINNYISSCDPVANAGNEIHFDNSTDDLQIGAGYANCGNGLDGTKISFGQKLCSDCPLINFSIGDQSNQDTIYSFGVSVKIK